MSTYTAFRCPNDLLKKAKWFADSERRSLSNYIIRLMEEDALRRTARQFYEQEKNSERLHGFADAARS